MQYRTRVKFCGITRLADAQLAVELGVDALGFVFYTPSPRYISPVDAAEIMSQLPPFICKVGLFVDAGPAAINEIVAALPLDIVQYHGQEPAAECAEVDRPYIKAVRMSAGVDLEQQALQYAGAAALLLDSFEQNVVGGTGSVFDWSRVPATLPKPIILAGGLTDANVAEAIASVNPYAVDVSSGIERAYGLKDPEKMRNFMHEVSSVER